MRPVFGTRIQAAGPSAPSAESRMTQRFLPVRAPVSLRTLLPAASFVGCADIRVTEATEHSAQCGPHTLFAAIPGARCQPSPAGSSQC